MRTVIALDPQSPLWLLGAVRLSVLSGSVALLGAVLEKGECADVVSPPFESAIAIETASVADTRLAAPSSPECSAVLERLGGGSNFGASFRAVVALDPVPHLDGYLDEYDCSPSELTMEWWSSRVAGACMLGCPPGAQIPSSFTGSGASAMHHRQSFRSGHVAVVKGPDGTFYHEGDDAPRARRPLSTPSCRVVARPTVIPPPWRGVVESILSHATLSTGYGVPRVLPQVLATGPKGAGKSTFMRYLVNAMLSASDDHGSAQPREDEDDAAGAAGHARLFPGGVAYLDMDCGQPEHGVPGCVSLALVTRPLLTPPHMRTPASAATLGMEAAEALARAGASRQRLSAASRSPDFGAAGIVASRFVGTTSPKADPQGYDDACAELLALYRAHLAPLRVPLVVNTHGWIKGVGFDTIQAMIAAAAPTHVVHFEADGPASALSPSGGYYDAAPASAAAAAPASSSASSGGGGEFDPAGGDDEGAEDGAESLPDGDSDGDGGDEAPAVGFAGGRAGRTGPPGRPFRPPRAPASDAFELPPAAYQPWVVQVEQPAKPTDKGERARLGVFAPLPSSSRPHRVWTSNLRVTVYRLQPWHTTAAQMGLVPPTTTGGAAGASSSASAAVAAAPPRAARSPVDLRSMRLMLYLLSGLACHAPGELAAAARRESGQLALEASPAASDGDEQDGESTGSRGDVDGADADAVDDTGAGGALASSDDDVAADGAPMLTEDDQSSQAASDSLAEDNGIDDEDFGAPALDITLPLTSQPAPVAAAHFWSLLKRGVRAVFWRVMAEASEARAPVTGIRSPAWALQMATPCMVPLSDVTIALSAAQSLRLLPGGGGVAPGRGGEEEDCAQRHLAECIRGQVVGLCSSSSSLPGTPAPPGGSVRASSLPCLGIGYVRDVDPASGLLGLLTPVPLASLRHVDVLVCWGGGGGAPDIPAQMLYRGHPHGVDAFAVPSHAIAPTSAATAKSATNRKQLKRRRLDGGGGAGAGGGGKRR